MSELIGVCDAGRSTIGLPAASAGATLCATRLSGKLNGVMPAIGPSGTRRTCADAALVARQPVERHDLAVDALRLLGRDRERERGAIDLERARS